VTTPTTCPPVLWLLSLAMCCSRGAMRTRMCTRAVRRLVQMLRTRCVSKGWQQFSGFLLLWLLLLLLLLLKLLRVLFLPMRSGLGPCTCTSAHAQVGMQI
jgi:hypothetical protein